MGLLCQVKARKVSIALIEKHLSEKTLHLFDSLLSELADNVQKPDADKRIQKKVAILKAFM